MEGEQATRFVLTHQEAGRPLPRFSADDYVDWCVMEAVVLKATLAKGEQQEKQRAAAERDQWKGTRAVTARPPAGGW